MARRVGGVAIVNLLELYDSGALKPNALQIKRLDFNRRDLSDGVALPQLWIKMPTAVYVQCGDDCRHRHVHPACM